MSSPKEALVLVFAMGAVILFCRVFPFLFFSGKNALSQTHRAGFLNFIERIVPPAAMTVLAFNALGSSFRDNPADGLLVLAASVFTALIHLWKRNTLVSIIGGTALYMFLTRVIVFSL